MNEEKLKSMLMEYLSKPTIYTEKSDIFHLKKILLSQFFEHFIFAQSESLEDVERFFCHCFFNLVIPNCLEDIAYAEYIEYVELTIEKIKINIISKMEFKLFFDLYMFNFPLLKLFYLEEGDIIYKIYEPQGEVNESCWIIKKNEFLIFFYCINLD